MQEVSGSIPLSSTNFLPFDQRLTLHRQTIKDSHIVTARLSQKARIGLIGAGLVGKRHADAIAGSKKTILAAIADPAPEAAAIAVNHNVPHFDSLEQMLDAIAIDGVILATPNQLHAQGAITAINAGLPVLIEKPICDNLTDARKIVAAGKSKNIAVAIGHHRRHNPIIAKAKTLIDEGRLGKIVSVNASAWLYKSDDYFIAKWRSKKGAGPVFINLIHDVDLMVHLCGPVNQVHAFEANSVRGGAIEDSAVILLRFASGALGTLNLSDTIPAPFSWELTAAENPAYPVTGQNCYHIGGTHGTLALPQLALWQQKGERSWWQPIAAEQFDTVPEDPLICQIDQFAEIILEGAPPLASAEDGLAALTIIEAIKQSATTQKLVKIADL